MRSSIESLFRTGSGSDSGPPRLLVLTTTLPAADDDGTPAFVADLSRALSDSYAVTILAPRTARSARRRKVGDVVEKRFAYLPHRLERVADGAIVANVARQPILALQLPFLGLAMLGAAILEVRRTRPSVIHAHWLLPAGLVATIIRRVFGIPFVVTVHGADAFALRGSGFDWLKRLVIRSAAATLPVSRDIADELRSLGIGDDNSLHVVPMGSPSLGSEDAGPRRPTEGELLFVGRLVEKKGVEVLIRAIARVDDVRLTLIGDGPLRPDIERLVAALNLEDRVSMLGQQPRSVVFASLRRAHALVIPSIDVPGRDRDGTPVVLAEAFATGTPVIASHVAGLAENVDHGRTGYLVHPGDVGQLAAAIRTAMERPAWFEDLGKAALATFETGPLHLEATARAYHEVLKQLRPTRG